jgi:PAS domain S-box-containing protein
VEGRVDLVNRRWADYTGEPPAGAVGRQWSDAVHPDDRGRVRDLRERAEAAREAIELEVRFRRHDGAYRWHLARVVPVVLPAGAGAGVVAWYGAALDIEDRKQEAAALARTVGELQAANADLARVSDDLQAANAELATTNAELAAANVEARAARAVAEQASEAKTQFLATMSHELRTPLNAVLGYVDLLGIEDLAGPLTAAQRGYLDRVTASARHLLGLIDEVLDLSKVEAGRMAVVLHPTAPGPEVLAAAALVRPQAAAKGLALVVEPSADADAGSDDGGGPRVIADPDRLRQVLVNLLGNAVKFTAAGGRVTAARRAAGRRRRSRAGARCGSWSRTRASASRPTGSTPSSSRSCRPRTATTGPAPTSTRGGTAGRGSGSPSAGGWRG